MRLFPPAERLARLRLIRTDGIGPVAFAQLLAEQGSAAAALSFLESKGKAVCTIDQALQEIDKAEALGAVYLFHGEEGYPALMAEVPVPPPVLVVSGDTSLLGRPMIGMVGARNASAMGRTLARQMAEELGEAGYVVVSGLARGVDREAHIGALDSGTIACVGGGVDVIYPPENKLLHDEIGCRGLLVSEHPCGTEPQARHFPRRNRLIAGLSMGLVVIEAAQGSGSLITARNAAEYGRDVMAVPGHPADPRSKGGNGLIRDGAHLVENAEDVLAILGLFSTPVRPIVAPVARQIAFDMPKPPLGAANESGLLPLLSVSGIGVDELVRSSGLSASQVQAQLGDLEIEGQIIRLAGGRVALNAV